MPATTTHLPDPYPVRPFLRPVHGAVRLPGSKSITNRAVLLAALSNQTVRLRNALFSRDTAILAVALRTLEFHVEQRDNAREILVSGRGGKIPAKEATLNVGNAGTAARFLLPFLCLQRGGTYAIDGDPAMRKRPLGGLLDALEAMGAAEVTCHATPGYLPLTLRTKGLPGGEVEVDAGASSQFLTALLIASPYADQEVKLRLKGEMPSEPFIAMTLRMMDQFGRLVRKGKGTYAIPAGDSYQLSGSSYMVEPDATAASYFLALPLVCGGSLWLRGLEPDMLQGDIAFADVLARIGLDVEEAEGGFQASLRPTGLEKGKREIDFTAISDTFLTLAAIAPLLPGPTRITGIAHTRHQETDRVAAAATELRRLGQGIEEEEDAITITPDPDALRDVARNGVTIETYEDHRIAMSFAVLGCRDLLGAGLPWLRIENPGCCGKTFPSFFDVLEGLREGRSATVAQRA